MLNALVKYSSKNAHILTQLLNTCMWDLTNYSFIQKKLTKIDVLVRKTLYMHLVENVFSNNIKARNVSDNVYRRTICT